MREKIFILFTLCLWSCISEIQDPQEVYINISNFQVDYDQLANRIFLQVTTETENYTIADVQVQITAEDPLMDTIFTLNDSAKGGDLIAMNSIYSGVFDIQLSFQEYQFRAVAQTHSGIETSSEKRIQVEEQFPPEILDIIFWKKYEDGNEYKIDLEDGAAIFQINDDEYSYLDFQVAIKEQNGSNDLSYIRYQINVEGMMAEDSCQYTPDLGYQNYSQWYLEYQYSTDTSFIYDVNNAYLPEPGIPIKPIILCGRTGTSFFRFIVSDLVFPPVSVEIPIEFVKCGDNFWNCEEDCIHCPMECGECEQ